MGPNSKLPPIYLADIQLAVFVLNTSATTRGTAQSRVYGISDNDGHSDSEEILLAGTKPLEP